MLLTRSLQDRWIDGYHMDSSRLLAGQSEVEPGSEVGNEDGGEGIIDTPGEARYQSRPWGERLKEWREEVKRWSRAELREQIEATSHRLREPRGDRIDTRLISRWESGAVASPQAVYQRLLAHLGAPLPGSSRQSPGVVGESEGDMDRRRFLVNAGTVLAVAAVAPEGPYGDRSVPQAVGTDHVRGIREGLEQMYVQDQQVGGGLLAKRALALYYDSRQMLDQADYGDGVGRELMSVVSELAVCVGWLSFDAGDQGRARTLYEEAFLLADQAGNPLLALQAVEKMTLQSVYVADRGHHRGPGREALRFAGRMTELARYQRSSRLHALIGGRQAIAHAVTGDRTGFHTAIAQAWRDFEGAVDDLDHEAWLQFVTRAEITVQEAKGYRYLGEPAEAVDLTGRVWRVPAPRRAIKPTTGPSWPRPCLRWGTYPVRWRRVGRCSLTSATWSPPPGRCPSWLRSELPPNRVTTKSSA